MVDRSRCGLMYSAARGTETCACASIVVLFGRAERPGLPCLRAAVSAYLFHISVIVIPRSSYLCRRPEVADGAGPEGPVSLRPTDLRCTRDHASSAHAG